MKSLIEDFGLLIGLILVIIGLISGVIFWWLHDSAAFEARQLAFMTECLQYEHQYECDYKWNMSTKQDYVPAIIPIPSGR